MRIHRKIDPHSVHSWGVLVMRKRLFSLSEIEYALLFTIKDKQGRGKQKPKAKMVKWQD